MIHANRACAVSHLEIDSRIWYRTPKNCTIGNKHGSNWILRGHRSDLWKSKPLALKRLSQSSNCTQVCLRKLSSFTMPRLHKAWSSKSCVQVITAAWWSCEALNGLSALRWKARGRCFIHACLCGLRQSCTP